MNFSTFLKTVLFWVMLCMMGSIYGQHTFSFVSSLGHGGGDDDCGQLDSTLSTLYQKLIVDFSPDPSWQHTNYFAKIYIQGTGNNTSILLPFVTPQANSINTLCGTTCLEIPIFMDSLGAITTSIYGFNFYHLGLCSYTIVGELWTRNGENEQRVSEMPGYESEGSGPAVFTSKEYVACDCELLEGQYSGTGQRIRKNGPANNVIVFPNPFTSEINIKLINNKPITKIELLDYTGRTISTVLSQEIDEYPVDYEFEKKYHTSDLSSGIYFLRVTTPSGLNIKKLVKR